MNDTTLDLSSLDAPILTAAELVQRHAALRPPLVHGLLRRTETMNLVAAPKVGKSWLAASLALAVQSGGEWLGFKCERGNVLIDDLELHPETSAARLPVVAEAMGLKTCQWMGLHIMNERGALGGIAGLENRVEELQRLDLSLIIIDAWYRALPQECDENANGDVMAVYNRLDALAADIGCAFTLIHHTTKGNQSQKSVTDLGAGAGAQSRAADCHIGLRQLNTPGALGVSVVVRSWKPVADFAVRRRWPLFVRDGTLDPTDYEGKKGSASTHGDSLSPEVLATVVPSLLNPNNPKTRAEVIDELVECRGVSERKAKAAIQRAQRRGLVQVCTLPGQPRERRASLFVLPVDRNAT